MFHEMLAIFSTTTAFQQLHELDILQLVQ